MKRWMLLAPTLLLALPGWPDAAPPTDPAAEAPPKPKPIDPPKAGALEDAIQRGVAFLLRDQNKDGSWGSAERTKGLNIYAPVPGAHHAFQTAVTSLVIAALIETGGDGADVFRFMSWRDSTTAAADIIHDFRANSDRLDLRAIGLGYVDDSQFTAARQVRWQHVGSETRVLADLNGDGKADFLLRLSGHIDLDRGDFLL